MAERHDHKPAKKAAKKTPAKKAPHSPARDARRAYEHLGRVHVLMGFSKRDRQSLDTILGLATQTFQAKRYKQAAELLRAAEHIAFAGLVKNDKEGVSPELRKEIENELTHLERKAAEHASPDEMDDRVRELFHMAAQRARERFEDGAFRSALDYARGAEALTHVDGLELIALPRDASKRLAS